MALQILFFVSIGIPTLLIFAFGFNRICIFLFDRYRNEVFTSVQIPKLSEEQKNLFKKYLDKANYANDRWYIANLSCVDALVDGKPLNCLDYHRLYDASTWYSWDKNLDDKKVFDEVSLVLRAAISELENEVKKIKNHNKLLSEQDIANKQIKLSILSTIAACFSAVAAIASCYIAYKFQNPH